MSWWTTVPGLTPVAAFDASRISGTQLLDGVGGNHITATSTLLPNDFQFKSVSGNGNPMALSTPIPMPATGVVAGFWAPKRRTVLLTPAYNDTSSFALHLSADGQGWYAAKANAYAPYGLYGSIGTRYFVAIVTRGSDSILYVDGNLVGVPVSSSYTMSQIGQVGCGANGNEYNLDADEYFHALGIWTGVATQADVQALEAACRAELVGDPLTFRGYSADVGRLVLTPPDMPASLVPINRGQVLGTRNIYQGGTGRVAGTVKVTGTPNAPVHRKVNLIDEATSMCVQSQWSDAITGAYTFDNVDLNAKFTVVSYDHLHNYRAVIADNIIPEVTL
jgi:hypothetical protein